MNSWSLLYDVLNGTLDKEYPIVDKKKKDPELDRIERMGGFEWTPGSPWPPRDPEEDGLDYENSLYETCSGDDLMADVDDQRSHHFSYYDDGFTIQVKEQMAHYFKYHEKEILKDIEEYVSQTYQGHYTGTQHEYRNVQTLDLMASKDLASAFCQANILKYGSRYGNKDGKNKKDLMKVIHYAMLLLHFDGHYKKSDITSGNIDMIDHNMP
tara:strand:+ start:11445 stop:12077 length:633 start_codon:yes stop_codon:yes gene_type:complete